MRQAPEFEPFLPHSCADNAISRILNFAKMIFSQATIFTAIGAVGNWTQLVTVR